LIITGTDDGHYINSRMLISSWWKHCREIPLLFCDYGMTPEHAAEVRRWPVWYEPRPRDLADGDGWRCKAGMIRFLNECGVEWENLIWIDADAIFLQPLPSIAELMRGYDLLIDAHRLPAGEIIQPVNLARLPVDPADAYFSSGFWITNSRPFLERWDQLVERVIGTGNLWENDAFVAAAYETRCSIRTIAGNVWHTRGMTSLNTAEFKDGELSYAGMPIRVLHANDGYTTREDRRRVFNRPTLAMIQDHYDTLFDRHHARWELLGTDVTAAPECRLHAIFVGHWAGNLGDSAAFDAFEQLLPPGTKLTCEVLTVGDWRTRENTTLIDWTDRKACHRAVAEADAVVLLGTTIVTDLHGGEWPIVQLSEALNRVRAAGKPVFAAGVGVYPGPWDWQRKRLAEDFVGHVDAWTTRDDRTHRALLDAGVAPDCIVPAADLAWLLDRPFDLDAARAEITALTAGRPAIAINLVHEDWIDAEGFYRGIAEELDAVNSETGCTAVFMCNEVRPGDHYDGAAARRVAGLMQSPAAVLEPRWMHPEEMIARIACCELAVSMRYHFSIFAAMAGLPWVAFSRGGKLMSLLESFGYEPVGPMGEPPNGRLLAALRETWSERQLLQEQQPRTVTEMRRRALRMRSFVESWIWKTATATRGKPETHSHDLEWIHKSMPDDRPSVTSAPGSAAGGSRTAAEFAAQNRLLHANIDARLGEINHILTTLDDMTPQAPTPPIRDTSG
jgi:polysaccharide pyruvyl transferase WcaK-like protein